MALIIKDLNNSFPPTVDEIIRRRPSAADALQKLMACHDRINSTHAAMAASSAALSKSMMGLSSVTSMSYALEAAQRAAAPNHLMDASSFSLSKSMSDFSRENSPYYAIAAAQRAAAPNYLMDASSVAMSKSMSGIDGAEWFKKIISPNSDLLSQLAIPYIDNLHDWRDYSPLTNTSVVDQYLDSLYWKNTFNGACDYEVTKDVVYKLDERLESLERFLIYLEEKILDYFRLNPTATEMVFNKFDILCTKEMLYYMLIDWESHVDKKRKPLGGCPRIRFTINSLADNRKIFSYTKSCQN